MILSESVEVLQLFFRFLRKKTIATQKSVSFGANNEPLGKLSLEKGDRVKSPLHFRKNPPSV